MRRGEIDPYLVPSPRSTSLVRRAAQVAIAAGVLYLAYRAVVTVPRADLAPGVLLLVAEALALIVFVLRARAAWNEPVLVPDVLDAPVPPTTVVIDAARSAPDEVRTTLVSCRRLRGVERIVVADPSDSPALRAIAARFDAQVQPRSATAVAAEAPAMWVLLVRAGDLPLPDALELLATPCSSPEVGIVQLGVEEANPSSFEPDPGDAWALAPFEHQVVRPSLAAAGPIPWYGDVPAMVRPAAIRDADDLDASTIELGLHALGCGYRVTMVPRTLARLRGPRSLSERLRRRFDRTSDLRRLATRRLVGFPVAVRRALRFGLADPLAALHRLLLVLVAVLALAGGWMPIVGGSPIVLAGLAAVAYGTRWWAQIALGRGRFRRLQVFRNELRCLGVDLAFGRRSLFAIAGSRARVLSATIAALALAVVVGAVATWRGGDARMSTGATAIVLALTAGFMIVAVDIVLDMMARRHRRQNHRVRLGQVAARLGEHDGQLHDLSLGGCAVALPATVDHHPRTGDEVIVEFRIPDADGAWRDVATAGRVAHVAVGVDGAVRVGLSFLTPVDPSLDPVVEFLTIDRRLVALGRRNEDVAEDDWAAAFSTPV